MPNIRDIERDDVVELKALFNGDTAFMARLPILKDVPYDCLKAIIGHMHCIDLDPNEIFVREGTKMPGLYYISGGSLVVSVNNSNVAFLKVGAMVGEMTTFGEDDTPATATLSAGFGGASVIGVFREVLNDEVLSDAVYRGNFFEGLAKFLVGRVKDTNKRVCEMDAKNKELEKMIQKEKENYATY